MDLLFPKDAAGAAPIRMMAVSALEEVPPQRLKKGIEPLHGMPLTIEGEAGIETARTVVRRDVLVPARKPINR